MRDILLFCVLVVGAEAHPFKKECINLHNCADCKESGCFAGVTFDDEFQCFGQGQEHELDIMRRMVNCEASLETKIATKDSMDKSGKIETEQIKRDGKGGTTSSPKPTTVKPKPKLFQTPTATPLHIPKPTSSPLSSTAINFPSSVVILTGMKPNTPPNTVALYNVNCKETRQDRIIRSVCRFNSLQKSGKSKSTALFLHYGDGDMHCEERKRKYELCKKGQS